MLFQYLTSKLALTAHTKKEINMNKKILHTRFKQTGRKSQKQKTTIISSLSTDEDKPKSEKKERKKDARNNEKR